ncbi:hypothetical protein ACLOJK_033268 [Asimina triloba]
MLLDNGRNSLNPHVFDSVFQGALPGFSCLKSGFIFGGEIEGKSASRSISTGKAEKPTFSRHWHLPQLVKHSIPLEYARAASFVLAIHKHVIQGHHQSDLLFQRQRIQPLGPPCELGLGSDPSVNGSSITATAPKPMAQQPPALHLNLDHSKSDMNRAGMMGSYSSDGDYKLSKNLFTTIGPQELPKNLYKIELLSTAKWATPVYHLQSQCHENRASDEEKIGGS